MPMPMPYAMDALRVRAVIGDVSSEKWRQKLKTELASQSHRIFTLPY